MDSKGAVGNDKTLDEQLGALFASWDGDDKILRHLSTVMVMVNDWSNEQKRAFLTRSTIGKKNGIRRLLKEAEAATTRLQKGRALFRNLQIVFQQNDIRFDGMDEPCPLDLFDILADATVPTLLEEEMLDDAVLAEAGDAVKSFARRQLGKAFDLWNQRPGVVAQLGILSQRPPSNIMIEVLTYRTEAHAVEYLQQYLETHQGSLLLNIPEVGAPAIQAQWTKPATSPSSEKPHSNVAIAWNDNCPVSLSAWALDFAETLLDPKDDGTPFAADAKYLTNMFGSFQDKDIEEPWHQKCSLSTDIMVALDMAFSSHGFYFAHQFRVGSSASSDFVILVKDKTIFHHRPIGFGDCQAKERIQKHEFKAQVSSKAHHIVRRCTKPITSQVSAESSSSLRSSRYTKVLPPMLNINANETTLQFQLVFFVTPTDPMAKLVNVPPSQNSMVVIPLALLTTAPSTDTTENLRRALVAVRSLLATLADVDPIRSWPQCLKVPAEGYTFVKLLSPTTQLWKSADASATKLVVKVYDYYMRKPDTINESSWANYNRTEYRSPLPKDALEGLAGINPAYHSWKVVTLLSCPGEQATPLVQQVHYPYVEGSHVPQSLGQFGTLLDLTHHLHTEHNIVFADMLLRNIVFPPLASDPALLIDFDLSGTAGRDTYPANFNVSGHLAPYRHPEALEGKVMETSHDCHALATMVEMLWPELVELHEIVKAGQLEDASLICRGDMVSLKPVAPRTLLKPGTDSP